MPRRNKVQAGGSNESARSADTNNPIQEKIGEARLLLAGLRILANDTLTLGRDAFHPRPIFSIICPSQFVDPSLIWPFVRTRHQSFPQWIFPHVIQLLFVFLAVAHSMMERLSLPGPRLVRVTAAELALPKLNPLINAKMQITRRAKEMQMIRHEQIIASEPRARILPPELCKRVLHDGTGHPWHSVFGVDRDKENIYLSGKDVRASCGRPASNIRINSLTTDHE